HPARALAVEYGGPIDVARAELRDRGVAPVRAADAGANAEAALDEVQPVPALAADAVVLPPEHVRLIDATLKDEVLHEPADRVVGQRRHQRRIEAEAALQPARDVVLAAAFPDPEGARRVQARLAPLEADEHLTE